MNDGLYGTNVCYLYDYKLTAANGVDTLSWLTLQDTRTIKLLPVVDDPIGQQTVRIYAKLSSVAEYAAASYFEFTVTINECVATINPGTPSITDIVYEVGMVTQTTTAFPEYTFTPGCDYSFTYQGF